MNPAADLILKPTAIAANRRVLALEFVRRYWRDHGASPSFREIAAAVGCPHQHVGGVVRYWVRLGKLRWTAGIARSIEPAEPLAGHATSDIVLELLRRGFTVNGLNLNLLEEATDLELSRAVRRADTDHGDHAAGGCNGKAGQEADGHAGGIAGAIGQAAGGRAVEGAGRDRGLVGVAHGAA